MWYSPTPVNSTCLQSHVPTEVASYHVSHAGMMKGLWYRTGAGQAAGTGGQTSSCASKVLSYARKKYLCNETAAFPIMGCPQLEVL